MGQYFTDKNSNMQAFMHSIAFFPERKLNLIFLHSKKQDKNQENSIFTFLIRAILSLKKDLDKKCL